ncbi:MAG: hypothetical protein FWC73_14320 [Defluviitaleaceae bacterium]|nr:hypothetical protein [Defluviitaleaceae bacterium]
MKLGFIDYYLDEFHANKYPEWIAEASKGEIQVAYAYGEIDSPSGMTTDQWCAEHKIMQLDSIEALVEKSDGIIVLAPDNPERHETLCKLPLQSGKRVYVDKTFAETREVATQLFDIATANNTSCYSSSALRFASEFIDINKSKIENIVSRGPGLLDGYSIHQIEPLIALMGPDVAKVIYTGTEKWPVYACEYSDGRVATISHHGWECPFGMTVGFKGGTCKDFTITSDFFGNFIKELVNFFETGEVKVPHEETIAVIAVVEAAIKASKEPGKYIEL